MAQQVFVIGQDDTGPPIQWICKDGNGAIVNCAAATVKFHMTDLTGKVIVDAAGDVPNGGTDGVVEYKWASTGNSVTGGADTHLTGAYNAEFQVTFAGGLVETFPVTPKILVQVFAKLAP